MTGDAILNLSRTTHSPEYLPLHSKRRSVQQPSNSVPTSPSDQAVRPKPWEPDTPAKTPVSSSLGRNSKSEEALVHLEKEAPTKQTVEERTFSHSTLEEGVTETERIVWTYNAPLSSMTEKELRRYEADQFWLSTRTEKSFKETKQIIRLEESTASTTTTEVKEESYSSSSHVADSKSGCDTQISDSVTITSLPKVSTEEKPLNQPETNAEPSKDNQDDTPVSPVRSPLTRSSTEEESDADSLQSVHYSPKGVDMPSAIRLAKR